MPVLFGVFPFCKRIRRNMSVCSVKGSLARYGVITLLILLTILFWIFSTPDQHSFSNKLGNVHGYDFENRNIVSVIRHNTPWRETHISRRRDHVKDAGNGSRDFRATHQQGLSPMKKILKLSGQELYELVDDPDFIEMHNFQKYSAPRYLKNFKNPCLYRNVSLGRHTKSPSIVRLRCVPYFMIPGFPKCGTTDLWSTLLKHPGITWSHPKEINFFNKKHFDFVPIENAVEFYQKKFTLSTIQIEKCVSKTNPDFHPCITGDASVDTIFDNKLWRKLPGNEHRKDPFLTNANYVHSINPNMKIIILLRDPVERLYSDYLYTPTSIGYTPSPEDFHSTVVDNISNYTVCLKHRTHRACTYDMYDDWNVRTYKVRLKVGIYHIFISDWLKVFPQQNVMVIKSEDTRGPNRIQTLMKIFRFLGLAVFSRKEVEKFYSSQSMNQRNRRSERMLPKTRKVLTEFYKMFNKELETLVPHIQY